jgi:hypothetical protein
MYRQIVCVERGLGENHYYNFMTCVCYGNEIKYWIPGCFWVPGYQSKIYKSLLNLKIAICENCMKMFTWVVGPKIVNSDHGQLYTKAVHDKCIVPGIETHI